MMVMTTSAITLLRRLAGPVQSLPSSGRADLTLRFAGSADEDEIDRLAQLDSRRAPRGVVIVAEVDGAIWAALSVDDGHAVSDPFHLTGDLVLLLLERARQLRRSRKALDAPRVWPRTGYDRPAAA
jgi:hypothetical protein